MLKSKLILLLKSLEKKEMTRFNEFLASPYHNKQQETRDLGAYFHKIYPHFTEKNCERTLIFKKVFKKADFNQARLNLVFTYTFRLLEKFLIQEQLKEASHTEAILLLQKLRYKQLFPHFKKKLQQTQNNLQKDIIQDSNSYRLQFQVSTEADEYHTLQSKHQKDQSIQNKQDSLDTFFISEKLKDACEMFLRNKLLKADYSIQLLEAVEKMVQDNFEKYRQVPSVIIYYQIYQMLIHDDAPYFHQLMPILAQHIHHFNLIEQRSIYDYAQNFCIARINEGDEVFLEELFKLYQAQLSTELLIEKGYLLEWHYKNIVTVGLRLHKYEWVHKFIEDFKTKLHPDSLQNAYRYNLAAYFYDTLQYKKVLELVGQIEFKDIRYSLGAKSILLRTYYDLKEYEALASHSHAFKIYLNRNKLISDYRKKGFYHLIKFTERLAKLKAEIGFVEKTKIAQKVAKIQKDIETSEPIFNKKWLLKHINDFI